MQAARDHAPADAAALCGIVRDAAAAGRRLAIVGGGSKAAIGRPLAGDDADTLSMAAFSGIVDYDPPELVLTAGAATPLAEIAEALGAEHQMLGFEPVDIGPALGDAAGRSTIGGVIASGFSGSQRLTHGAVRDHLLGFSAVSGRGERFVAGAKVVKNVTGYDLPKLMCGSWGRLAALTEVTLKVLPRPTTVATMVCAGLSPPEGWSAMAHVLGSQAEVAAAAYLPAGVAGRGSITALRLQGFAPSVAARCELVEALGACARFDRVGADEGAAIWAMLRDLSALPATPPLWRVALPARAAPGFVAEVAANEANWLMDWAGGLVWLASDRAPEDIRAAAAARGGHAALVRASAAMRATVPPLHPQPAGVAALEQRVRRAFDPCGVFETGRF